MSNANASPYDAHYLISRCNADGAAELLTDRPVFGLQSARDLAADYGAVGALLRVRPFHAHAVEAWEGDAEERTVYEIFEARPGHALCCGIDWKIEP